MTPFQAHLIQLASWVLGGFALGCVIFAGLVIWMIHKDN